MKKITLLLAAFMLAAVPVMAATPAQPAPTANKQIVKASTATVKKNHKKKGKKVDNKKHSKKAASKPAAPVTDNSAGPQ